MHWIATFLVVLSASSSLTGLAALPENICQFAKEGESELIAAVSRNDAMLREAGLSPRDLELGQFDCQKSLREMRPRDADRVQRTAILDQAVVATGTYVVPFCIQQQCPYVGRFSHNTQAPQFEGFGEHAYASRLEEARGEALTTGEQMQHVLSLHGASLDLVIVAAKNGEKKLMVAGNNANAGLFGAKAGTPRFDLETLRVLIRQQDQQVKRGAAYLASRKDDPQRAPDHLGDDRDRQASSNKSTGRDQTKWEHPDAVPAEYRSDPKPRKIIALDTTKARQDQPQFTLTPPQPDNNSTAASKPDKTSHQSVLWAFPIVGLTLFFFGFFYRKFLK